MISTKSQVPAAPSSKKFKHTYNSIEPKLCKVTELCCEVCSLPAYFFKSKKKNQTLLSGGKMLQPDLTYVDHKIYMF